MLDVAELEIEHESDDESDDEDEQDDTERDKPSWEVGATDTEQSEKSHSQTPDSQTPEKPEETGGDDSDEWSETPEDYTTRRNKLKKEASKKRWE